MTSIVAEMSQWSEMKSSISNWLTLIWDVISVKMKSSMFHFWWVGWTICCFRPSASIVSTKILVLLSLGSSICMLKSPSITAFSMLGSFAVSSSVISSRKIVFVWSCFGGGWCKPRISVVLFLRLTCQIANSIVCRCYASIFLTFILSL